MFDERDGTDYFEENNGNNEDFSKIDLEDNINKNISPHSHSISDSLKEDNEDNNEFYFDKNIDNHGDSHSHSHGHNHDHKDPPYNNNNNNEVFNPYQTNNHHDDHSHSHSHSHGHNHDDHSHSHSHSHGHNHDDHSHSHSHGHGHNDFSYNYKGPIQSQTLAQSEKKSISFYLISILNEKETRSLWGYLIFRTIFTLIALFVGIANDSLSLVCISFEMFFDCIGIAVEMIAVHLNKLHSSDARSFSYGYGRLEILAGFGNATFMIFISLFTLQSVVERIIEPPEVTTGPVMTMSVAILIINLIGLAVFQTSKKYTRKSNQVAHEVLLLHIITGNVTSLIVIGSTWLVSTGYPVADPIGSGFIAFLILYASFPLAKQTGSILLLTTPQSINNYLYKYKQEISTMEGVLEVTESYFWTQDPNNTVASMNLRIRSDANESDILDRVQGLFSKVVNHLTIQIEKDDWNNLGRPDIS
eukprot:TRINITY_DN443_c1_g4_i2.p1 TRINITY_DN443_c1_g4~~TRINITY_DN443_c1_g4_i2.p1  ORF type:complete len:472 (+),score=124.49 TRINITY_DN443_c1_g4_i2:85-1500(+)